MFQERGTGGVKGDEVLIKRCLAVLSLVICKEQNDYNKRQVTSGCMSK